MRKRMFTLVELMIVVIIVAILAASAVPIYRSVVGRAYEAEVVSALATFRTAQRIFRAEKGEYPDDKDALEAENLIGDGDFVDMKYVAYTDFTAGDGSQTWSGSIDGYDYDSVTMDAGGEITRSTD